MISSGIAGTARHGTSPNRASRQRVNTLLRSAPPAASTAARARRMCGSWGSSPIALSAKYAFTVAETTPVGAILEAVRKAVPALVREVEVFDQYRGKGVEPGQKSLALRIVMQDTDRTLTDSDVEGVVASIRQQLNEKFHAKPRT